MISDTKVVKISNKNESVESRIVQVPQNSKEAIYAHICWIYVWCFTLSFQDEREAIFRMNQLREVLRKLKANYRFNLKTDLFYLMIDACYHYSSYKISHTIFETMQQYDVQPDNRIKLMHFDHRREAIKKQKSEHLEKIS